MKIVCLSGGISTERQVALVTGTSVCKALRRLGHRAIFVDMYMGLEDYDGRLEDAFDAPDGFCGELSVGRIEPNLDEIKASRKYKSPSHIGKNVLEICALADCVFLGLHGADGEDGKIQATLDLLGIPYTGSGHLGSAMAMDKASCKRVMDSFGIGTPAWQELTYKEEDIPALLDTLPLPCAVKIVDGGSSIGVELPENKQQLEAALRKILAYGNRVIVEEKISGIELTVPVLGDKALSPIEIVPPEGASFDYVAKYQGGKEGAREICPARIDAEATLKVQQAALKLHRALRLSAYSRTDFILDEAGNAWCLEINTLPGMTPNSLLPKAALIEGLSYEQLCQRIIDLAFSEK